MLDLEDSPSKIFKNNAPAALLCRIQLHLPCLESSPSHCQWYPRPPHPRQPTTFQQRTPKRTWFQNQKSHGMRSSNMRTNQQARFRLLKICLPRLHDIFNQGVYCILETLHMYAMRIQSKYMPNIFNQHCIPLASHRMISHSVHTCMHKCLYPRLFKYSYFHALPNIAFQYCMSYHDFKFQCVFVGIMRPSRGYVAMARGMMIT